MDIRTNTFDTTSARELRPKYSKIGRVYCFFLNSEGSPKITIGPHWPMMLISVFVLLTTSIIFTVYICPEVGTVNTLVSVLIFLVTLVLFLSTALLNPGMVLNIMQMKSKGDFNSNLERICSDCNVVRESFTEHCKKCRICINELDDHYILLGKCVGKHTIKYFYGLLICGLSLLIFIVTTLFFRFKDKFS